jgi:hypothetical protein
MRVSEGVPVIRLLRKRSHVAVIALVFVAVSSSGSILVARASPSSDAAIEAVCRKDLKHTTCSEALGRWLPFVDTVGGRKASMTPTRVFDGFRKTPGTTERAFSASVPAGTAFAHGDAGPPQGLVVYDRLHRLAFYGQGCCSYFTVVLAANVGPPPVSVADRNLTHVKTDAGVGLGDSPASVMRIYGRARLQRVASHPEMQILDYENRTPPKPTCVQHQQFGFTQDRLRFISIDDAC